MSTTEEINCGEFIFYNNFDSANLARVEQVQITGKSDNGCDNEIKCSKSSTTDECPEFEFNLWTKHDCHGTEYQNNNRTWFYFGIRTNIQRASVKFNIMNLNKQVKMFSQGMSPVFKVVPGHLQWERIREKPTYSVSRSPRMDGKGIEFNLSFTYRMPDNSKAITYFAFTYPFTYTDLQNYLKKIDTKMAKRNITSIDDIYYHRECAIKSLEGRRLDLLTISSYHNILTEREARIKNMFPESDEERPFKFKGKKIIFLSARVHPGETPSSFVLNGFLNFLLNRDDMIAINLRRLYVFKLLPMLNPDGVARGHYRMDTRGVNLNRVYLNPSRKDHPTIYAARNLIKYHHHRYELPNESNYENGVPHVNLRSNEENVAVITETNAVGNAIRETNRLLQQVTMMSLEEKNKVESSTECSNKAFDNTLEEMAKNNVQESIEDDWKHKVPDEDCNKKIYSVNPEDSGLFLYIDMHGHASKKGIFMYGNYFDDPEDSIMCMLLPKLMSINNTNFHFASCNFAERNMYLIDKRDGMSREGSGRVAVYKLTGLIRSYTLECNYNSGRLVNTIPSRVRDCLTKTQNTIFSPPKYTPAIFEEVGAALGPSILDLTNNNPNSRLPNSQYRSIRGIKSYLKLTYVNNFTASLNRRLRKENTNVPQESTSAEFSESQSGSVHSDNSNNCPKGKDESLSKKPCIIRRSTSLYTAIKKIKTTKKPRVMSNRKTLKATAGTVSENNPILSKVMATQIRGRKFSKVAEFHPEPKVKMLEKTTLIDKQLLNQEETVVVKQGSKRLKVTSSKSFSKMETEIVECPNTDKLVPSKTHSKISSVYGKQKTNKDNFTKSRIKSHKMEQTKSKKSSKIKGKSQSNLTVDNYCANDCIRSGSLNPD